MAAPRMLPRLQYTVDIPDRSPDVIVRRHNQFARESMKAALEWHKSELLPRHFKKEAHGRYGYFERNQMYIAQKRKRWHQGGEDLVATGHSRDKILREG